MSSARFAVPLQEPFRVGFEEYDPRRYTGCVQFLNTGHKCLEKFPAARVNTDRDIIDACGRSLL